MSSNVESLIWVTEDSAPLEITIYLYVDQKESRISSVSKFPIPELLETGLTESQLVSQWSIPSRANMESYRRKSARFNPTTGTLVVDDLIVSDCVVANHLRGLSIDGIVIELERDESQALTQKSLDKVKSLQSGIFDLLYDKYRSEACLFT